MKTLNVVTVSLIVSMLSMAAVNFSSKEDGHRVGRGGSQLGRFQPWSPGWIRPESRIAVSAKPAGFHVEPVRNPSTL
jgi:hypothetical protein